jgi:hypothetical protein
MINGLFTELQNGLDGYWPDSLDLDRRMIENNNCPECGRKLVYKGFSNPERYKAFGICEPCEYARHFWTEPAVFVSGKKRFSKAGAEGK